MCPASEATHRPNRAADVKPATHDAIEGLVDLARRCRSPQEFFKQSLSVLGPAMNFIYAELEVQQAATVTRQTFCIGDNQAFWEPTVDSLLTEAIASPGFQARLFRGVKVDLQLAMLTVPLCQGQLSTRGALVAVVPCADRAGAQTALTRLASMSTLMSTLSTALGGSHGGPSPAPALDVETASALARSAQYTSQEELAYALTNKLRTRNGCDQVCLAMVRGNHVRLLSISGLDDINHRSPGVKHIIHAMEECLDFGKPVVQQSGPEIQDPDIITGGRLHLAWHQSASGAPVASIPLMLDDHCIAIMSVRRSKTATFAPEDLAELRGMIEHYAPALQTIGQANQSLMRHVRRSMAGFWQGTLVHASWTRRAALACVSAFVLWVCFGTMQYEVVVHGSVVPAETRQVAAPADGVLRVASLIPGDFVHAGDVLCQFDTIELELELERQRGEFAMLRVDELQAMAGGTPAEERLARAHQQAVQASIDLLELRVAQSVVRAPVDGVILEGDLGRRIGDVFTKGDPLFELSTNAGWKLELEIPESVVSEFKVGQQGRFASHSRPEDTHELEIVHLHPSAERRGLHNVFLAEATSNVQAEWMRSGVEGLAKIEAGERSPLWVAFHRITDYIRLHLWL